MTNYNGFVQSIKTVCRNNQQIEQLRFTVIKNVKPKFYILKSILKLSKVVRYADSKNFAL